MDQFIAENIERYQTLVKKFQPPAIKSKDNGKTTTSAAIAIGTRIRPILPSEVAAGQVPGTFLRKKEPGCVDLHELRRPVRGLPTLNSYSFKLDRVYGPDATTAEVYQELLEPLVPWVWGGGVGTLFAYGQTGSGKTYTVSELTTLVAKALMGGTLGGKRIVHISIIEISGNVAYDLLNTRKRISILEDSFGSTQLAGALEHHMVDTEGLLSQIELAACNRKTAQTEKNDESSRSHSICRLRIENPDLPEAENGLLYLVDLAGSEAARDMANHSADRMKEAREINTSLSILKDCIRGRAELDAAFGMGKPLRKPYVPFRQSALTKVLKHVFDPDSRRSCKTAVVACVNPSVFDVLPSKNTLRYAEMLRVVVPTSGTMNYNPDAPATWTNEQLSHWIEKNSGTPAVSPTILAPVESGIQLLRIPVPEFLSRCLQTPGVTTEQAHAFQMKFWSLHVDSQRKAPAPVEVVGDAPSPHDKFIRSADNEPGADEIPFKNRVRPGMVVKWEPPEKFPMRLDVNLAVVLCPERAITTTVRDVLGNEVNQDKGADGGSDKYLCAMVLPAMMAGQYELSLWRQVVVDVKVMEAEVLLEYDGATRSYFLVV